MRRLLRLFGCSQFVIVALVWFPLLSLAQTGPGSAITFQGGTDYVSIPHNSVLNAYPLTVTAWVKTSASDSTARGIVGKVNNPATNGYALVLRNGHVWAAYARNASSYVLNGTNALDGGAIADGTWHHVAFVVDASGGRVYVDGVLKTSQAWTGTAAACSTSSSLLFGRYLGATMTGTVDEVAVWNVARTQGQIQNAMHRFLAGSESGLVGYWRLDDGVGTTATNSAASGSTLNGSLLNSPAWSTSTAPLGLPVVTPASATSLTPASATLNGSVLPNYQATLAWCRYGTTTNYGTTTGTTNINASNSSPVAINFPISGLPPATLYHFQLVATNSAGTNTSPDSTFSTLPNTNANLSALTTTAGALSPAFAPATTSYTVAVANGVSSATVTPTAADANATLQTRVNGGSYSPVASGNPSSAMALAVGANLIEIRCTAQDGTTARTYGITVTRLPSANADLSGLSLSAGVLSPAFSAGTIDYAANVSNCATPFSITATAAAPTASLQVCINAGAYSAVTSGVAFAAAPLGVGSNSIQVQVTAQSGTIKLYTVGATLPPRLPPIVQAGGPYVIAAGSSLQLQGVVASDCNCYNETVTNRWYLHGGTTADLTGASGTVPWSVLEALSLPANIPIPIQLVATDSQGLTAEAWTTLTITLTQPTFTGVSMSAAGTVQLVLNASSNVAHQIEASTNLFDWMVLASITNDIGTLLFTDASATNYPHRFYRAVPQLNVAPLASFTANPGPTAPGVSTRFDALGSFPSQPDAIIVSYRWNFGDGTTGTGAACYHAYTQAGVFNVTLTVTDQTGRTNQTSGTVNCQYRRRPEARAGGPYTISIGQTVYLDGSGSADPEEPYGDSLVTYEWDINGDGNFSDAAGALSYMTWIQLQPILTPAQYPADPRAGLPNIPIALRVTDTAGMTGICKSTLTVYSRQLVPVANWGPQRMVPINGSGMATVHLDGSASYSGDPGYSIVSWSWKINGSASSISGELADMTVNLNPLPSPIPASGISKTLVLRVMNNLSETSDLEFDVTFGQLPSQPPTIRFNVDRGGIFIEQGEDFSVNANLTTDPDGDWIHSVAWDVNNDETDDIVLVRTDTDGDGDVDGDDANPSLALQMTWAQMASYPGLQAVGNHTIRLTVTDRNGVAARDNVPLHMLEKALLANAAVTPGTGNPQTVFTFDGTQSRHLCPSQTITSWQWDFNHDGIFDATGQTVDHEFGTPGEHAVTLRVSDFQGRSNTNDVTVTVSNVNLPPVPVPSGRYTVSLGSGVTLNASSSFDPDAAAGDQIVMYAWDLDGDGQFEIVSGSPTIAVPASTISAVGTGMHRISLRVTDTFGATGRAGTTLTVTAP